MEAKSLEFPLDVSDDKLICVSLLSQIFDLDFQFFKEKGSIQIIILFEHSVFFFDSLEYAVVLFHLGCKLFVHSKENAVLLIELLSDLIELLGDLLDGGL
jgi:hypothetical protein